MAFNRKSTPKPFAYKLSVDNDLQASVQTMPLLIVMVKFGHEQLLKFLSALIFS